MVHLNLPKVVIFTNTKKGLCTPLKKHYLEIVRRKLKWSPWRSSNLGLAQAVSLWVCYPWRSYASFVLLLTSYSCLKPYPSAVFIWLMCWSRSATRTAGWSWPVWYGELFLRQWRWGEPPSKLLDSFTELRCSSENIHTRVQCWPTVQIVTLTLCEMDAVLFINIKYVSTWQKSLGGSSRKNLSIPKEAMSADRHYRIFKQTWDLLEMSLLRAPYGLVEQIVDVKKYTGLKVIKEGVSSL